jgi:BASS family bile acid:Na+ symporter
MVSALTWIGARARWVLLIGALLAVFLPDVSSFLRPAVPVFIAMVYMIAMLRIDVIAVARGMLNGRHAAKTMGIVGFMMIVSPIAAFWLAGLIGLGPDYQRAALYAFAAPPIASAASFCLMIGLNAAMALEVTVICSLIMPVVGPIIVATLVGADLDISPVALGLRMAAIIFSGAAAALVLRKVVGVARIERNGKALDGVAALGFLLFILPLFDGVGEMVTAQPVLALALFAWACLLMLGPSLFAHAVAPGSDDAGALGIVWGARSVAIYFAALPPDPVFALFVALYQIPMAGLTMLHNVLRRRDAR